MVKSFLKMATLTASLMVFSCDTYKEEIKELIPVVKEEKIIQITNEELADKLLKGKRYDIKIKDDAHELKKLLKKDSKEVLDTLENIWIQNYLESNHKDSHKGNIEKSLGRILHGESFEKALKGFSKGIEEGAKKHKIKLNDEEKEKLMKLVLVGVAESVWDNSHSQAGAYGFYQFMPKSAKSYGLIRNGKDYRNDSYESAKAAALHFMENYKRYKGNWELTLAAYNSGKPLHYYIHLQNKNDLKSLSYAGYLKYLLNSKSNENSLCGNSVENLNYPAKLNVVELIVSEKYPEVMEFIEGKISYEKLSSKLTLKGIKELPIKNYGEGSIKDIYSDDFVPHVVKKGDNLSNILKSKGVSPVRKNVKEVICGHYDNCKKIKVGTKVYIPKNLFNQEKEVKITHIESQLEKVRDLDKYHKHNVRKGENLSNILKSKGVSPTQANISQVICGKRNNCNKIQAGEKVYIPKTLLRN